VIDVSGENSKNREKIVQYKQFPGQESNTRRLEYESLTVMKIRYRCTYWARYKGAGGSFLISTLAEGSVWGSIRELLAEGAW
jgi:hypothetical protein